MMVTAGIILIASAVLAGLFVRLTPEQVLGGQILAPQTVTPQTGTISYTLPEGTDAGKVGDDLQDLGVIRSSSQFQVLAALLGVHDQLSAGDYILPLGAAIPVVLQAITVQEQVPVIKVTFPEGLRIEEMADIAETAGFGPAASFLAAAAAPKLPPEMSASLPEGDRVLGARFQGYLFPDTYILPVGSTAEQLVQEMVANLNSRFSPALRAAAAAQGLSIHQALTLASIVEREAVLESERPIIASVYLNRLRIGMKLDADPTVQFALTADAANVTKGGYWKLGLTLEDLKYPSPYNTYANAGLPPGPIANPGLASIEAVANPATTQYFYFVADSIKGDGSHVFAETLEQHLANDARVGGG
ncbi:hypothetical protein AYO38_06930 [bacterium SCGC AG-212-C10]|nr:hypothetical protein AYO38_06930 [bacterium SCGC AG-212-C10]